MKKLLVFGVIVLFLGLAIAPSINANMERLSEDTTLKEIPIIIEEDCGCKDFKVQPEYEIDIESKDYLFQTIINIANNPDIKELFEQYEDDLLKVDIDRNVYSKRLFRNPGLFSSLIFSKPSITQEYLDFAYTQGIKITNFLGEDKALEIIESIEVPDTQFFDEINNIIVNNQELSHRLFVLEEMNTGINIDWPFPIICGILMAIILFCAIPMGFFFELAVIVDNYMLAVIFTLMAWISLIPVFIIWPIYVILDCWYFVPEI